MKKILISTGGSGGHVLPAISLFEHLKDKFDVKLVTDQRGSKYIDNELFNYEVIDVPNIFSNLLKLPFNMFFFIYSIIKSFNYLKKNKIDILFSTGGYMSLPLCVASRLLKIHIFLLEPNMVIGRANNLILKFSKKILCYENNIIGLSAKYINKVFLIKPILRKEIYNINKNINNKLSEPIKILVLGGSQGAKFFDTKIKDLIINLSNFFNICLSQQIYDEKKIEELKSIYDEKKIENDLFKFDNKLHEKLNFFDLAITRSGASAITELSYLNIPFIAVPFPHARDNHQFYNAKYYKDKNCCWLIKQDDFEIEKMTDFVKNLMLNQSDYLSKKDNLINNSYQNTWNNINEKLVDLVNDN